MAHSTSTTHYELSQFAASDKPAWLVDYNGDNVKIDNGIYAASQKATAAISNFAPAFSSESTYDVGDMVTYENVMYKCIAAVTAAGPWNSNQWDAVTVADIVDLIPTSFDYADADNKPQINGNTLSGNKTGAQLGLGLVIEEVPNLITLTGTNMTFNYKTFIKINLPGDKDLYIINAQVTNPDQIQSLIGTCSVSNPDIQYLQVTGGSHNSYYGNVDVSVSSGNVWISQALYQFGIKGFILL